MPFFALDFDTDNWYEISYAPKQFQVNDDEWQITQDVKYIANDGNIYIVKAGFEYDGASKGFLKRFGRYSLAALLHDALYQSEIVERSKADDLFLEAMKHLGVNYFRRYAYYWAVRAAGWRVWQKHTDASIMLAKMYVEVIHV